MKFYLNPNQMMDLGQFSQWQQLLRDLKQSLNSIKISLSMEERRRSRKMGPRRLAYAHAAERRGVQHEDVMPRTFTAIQFTNLLAFYNELNKVQSQLSEIQEIIDDTLMAAGIDAMTLTKLVHDGLRSANAIDPSLDNALNELDEFNKKAQAEEEDDEVLPEGEVA